MAPSIPAVNPAGELVQGKKLCDDLQGAQPRARFLAVESKSKNWPALPEIRGLRRLWAYGVKPDQLTIVGQLRGLELLCLSSPKCGDFTPLANLKALRTLIIDNATQLADLSFLPHLSTLEAAHLSDMKRLSDIGPLAECRKLVELHLEAGIWTELKLHSLEPLRGLSRLNYLGISPQMKQPTLEPLRGLIGLEELSLNGRFPFEDYARLAGKLTKTKCKHFDDIFSDFSNIQACRKCKRKELIIGVFLKGPKLCIHCDRDKIEHWRSEFARIRDDAARRHGW
jgi:hypothetical protein